MPPRKALSSTPWLLGGLGLVTLVCYLLVAQLSEQFVPFQGQNEKLQRPIIAVLISLGIAHLAYLFALFILSQQGSPGEGKSRVLNGPLAVILGFAIVFRLVQLTANPIQEIDIYRYLWDGHVSLAGVNPYAYSPEAIEEGDVPPSAAERLDRLRSQPIHEGLFQMVDHRTVPTVYPPASQAVFALTVALIPDGTSVRGQVMAMKAMFVLFDLGTIALLIALLRTLGKDPAWCLAYAWCPLVIKEIANSGHLDALAIFCTTLTILFLVRAQPYAAMMAWAAAVLAKVYPLVLLPLIVVQLIRLATTRRINGRWMEVAGPLLLGLGMVGGTYALVWPPAPETSSASSPVRGLQVFLTEWKMNDLVFDLLYQGVDQVLGEEGQQWIVEQLPWWPRCVAIADPSELEPVPVAFVLAYGVAGGIFLGIVGWLAWRCWRESTRAKPQAAGQGFVEGVFYSLVFLFLLSPTANPWYLMWAVPFLPWARQRSWYLLPGLVLTYYLRFWFVYHYGGDEPTLFGRFSGQDFFDGVWVWIEYAPFFVVLAGEIGWQAVQNSTSPQRRQGRTSPARRAGVRSSSTSG